MGRAKKSPSPSEADEALVSKIAFYLGPDPQAIESLAKQSELYREKWDRSDGTHGSYIKRTINNALASMEEFYQLPRGEQPHQEDGEGEQSRPGFQLVQVGELEVKAPRWIARDYLEADSLAVAFGDPETGKSFLAIDIACSIASGENWHDHEVDPGPVVYIKGEGHNGFARRRKAWEIRHGADLSQAPFYASTAPAAMCDPDSLSQVLQAVDQVAQSEPPKLVVIDTLARNFGPGDESSTRDMTAFVEAADSLRVRYGCTVLVVHHVGHMNKDRARGAMALKGAADAEYRVEKDDSEVVRLTPVKMKDAPQPEPMAFALRTVELGFQDEDGREVTSAILDRTEYEPPAEKPTKAGRGKWQQVAQEQLQRLYENHRERLERSGSDPDQARVFISDWREACQNEGMPRNRWHDVKKLFRTDHKYVYPS